MLNITLGQLAHKRGAEWTLYTIQINPDTNQVEIFVGGGTIDQEEKLDFQETSTVFRRFQLDDDATGVLWNYKSIDLPVTYPMNDEHNVKVTCELIGSTEIGGTCKPGPAVELTFEKISKK